MKLLKYPVMEYPKGDNKRYLLGEKLREMVVNKDTMEVWYE